MNVRTALKSELLKLTFRFLREQAGSYAKGSDKRHQAAVKAWKKRERGIKRYKAQGMQYVKKTDSPEAIAFMQKLGVRIRPDLKDLFIDPREGASLLAIGRDKNDKWQPIYSAKHNGEAKAEKFSRCKDFAKDLPGITGHLKQHALTNEEAGVLYAIAITGHRVGGEKDNKARHKAYGMSTLEARHVKIDGNKVTLDYMGKSGQQIRRTFEDSLLAQVYQSRIKNKGPKDRIFNTKDDSVRDYLKGAVGKPYQVKDFRTHIGTEEAVKALAKYPKVVSAKEFQNIQKDVLKKVAFRLANSPKVAKEYYIAPEVWDTIQIDDNLQGERFKVKRRRKKK